MQSLRNKCFIVFLLLLFVASIDQAAALKKRRKIKARKARYYRYIPKPKKLYQQIDLSPKMTAVDISKIESALRERGVNSIKIDNVRNSLQVQYSAKVLTAVDIIQILRGMGFTVVSID